MPNSGENTIEGPDLQKIAQTIQDVAKAIAIVGAERSVNCQIYNHSDFKLVNLHSEFQHGDFVMPPDDQIPAASVEAFGARSTGAFTGTEGHVTYDVEGMSTSVTLSWDNPELGGNDSGASMEGDGSNYFRVTNEAGSGNTNAQMKYELFFTDALQDNWRFCQRCQGLAFAGNSAGICPAGSGHDFSKSSDYQLLLNPPPGPGDGSWRFCQKCQGMTHIVTPSPVQSASVCAAGGQHDVSSSGVYNLGIDNAPGQRGWGLCLACSGLVFTGNSKGVCPSQQEGGQHAVLESRVVLLSK